MMIATIITSSYLLFVLSGIFGLVSEAWVPPTSNHRTTTHRRELWHLPYKSSRYSQHRATTGTGALDDKDNDGIDRRWEGILSELDTNDDENVEIRNIASASDLRQEIRQQGSRKTINGKPTERRLQAKDFPRNPGPFSDLDDFDDNFYVQGDDDVDDGDDSILDNDDTDDELQDPSRELLTDEDSVFLDAETYLQYSNIEMGMDGLTRDDYDGYDTRPPPFLSERQLMDLSMPPDAPYDTSGGGGLGSPYTNKKEATFDDILALHRTMGQRKPPTPEEEKAIFEEIFKDETAYFKNTSDTFREGLTNKTAAEEATRKRRNSSYRKNHLKELSRLEKQIQEFEVLLKKEQEKNFSETAANPGTELYEPEIIFGNTKQDVNGETRDAAMSVGKGIGVAMKDEPEDEWVLFDDQSTKGDVNGEGSEKAIPTEAGLGVTMRDTPEEDWVLVDDRSTKEVVNGEGSETAMPEEEAPGVAMRDEPEEEWVLVDDPSTGEFFYWNSVTGDMSIDTP